MLSRHDGIEVLKDFHEAFAQKRGGEVVLRSGPETGRVFFVNGRIAWAAASTVKRTFMGYLVDHTKLDKEVLQEVFQACKVSGGNFGETIVEWGLLDEAVLRDLLLRHLSECLLEIFTWTTVESMFVPEERSYKGSFTYELREVLEMVVQLDSEGRLPFDHTSVDLLMEEVVAKPADPQPLPMQEVVARLPRKQRPWGWIAGGVLVGLLLVIGGVLFLRPAPPKDSASRAKAAAPRADATVDGSSVPEVDAAVASSQPATMPAKTKEEPQPVGIVVGLKGQGKGMVRVLSMPSRALIYLDGVQTRRRTPYTFKQVPAAIEHVLMVHRPRYRPAFKRFMLAPNMEAKLRFPLRRQPRKRRPSKEPISVRFESEPSGATIYLNRRAQQLITPTDLSLSPDRATLVGLRLTGFRRWRNRIRPVPGVPLTYKVQLKAIKKRKARRKRAPRRRRR